MHKFISTVRTRTCILHDHPYYPYYAPTRSRCTGIDEYLIVISTEYVHDLARTLQRPWDENICVSTELIIIPMTLFLCQECIEMKDAEIRDLQAQLASHQV